MDSPSSQAGGGAKNEAKDAAQGVHVKLTVKHAFGCQPTRLDGLQSFSASSGNKDYSDRLLHKVGKQVCVYDPETGQQEFFDGRPKNIIDVVHFGISSNSRFICMCENIRHDKGSSDAGSQVSIYSLTNLNRLKTLHHSLPRPFVCATFCGDPKLVAALSDEPDRHIVVWQWEKEKLFKVVTLSVSATLLRAAPCSQLMLTTSGNYALKHWVLAQDGNIKCGNFLPTAKETLDIYTDHVWMPSSLGNHRLIALVDPDSANELNRSRRQSIYIFEGGDTENVSSSSLPISAELKQTIQLKLDIGCRAEKIIFSPKTFMLVGMGGFVAAYERTDDKQEPYVESRRLSLGDKQLVGGTIYPSEEKMVLLTKQGRLLAMALDVTIDQIKRSVANVTGVAGNDDAESVHSTEEGNRTIGTPMDTKAASGVSDMRTGGHHTSAILAADMAFERPLVVTIGADATARVWNYLSGKCELVHYFRTEDPISVAFHPSGFQILVSFKDRIRSYNVLIDKIKPYRETVLKNCKCLKYSNGAQYWAAASAVNVAVYETSTFNQLMVFQGHLMTVVRLCWAPGDEVLFSAAMDGNVYGWPVSREGRMEVVSANNRSSAMLDIVADSMPTVFQVTSKDSDDDNATAVVATGAPAKQHGAVANGVDVAAAAQFQSAIANSSRSWLVISSLDGHMRMPSWSVQMAKQSTHTPGHAPTISVLSNAQAALSKFYPTTDSMPIIYGDSSVSITAIALNADRTKLFVGTSLGSLRVYPWPPDPANMPPYIPTGGSVAVGHHHGHHASAEKGRLTNAAHVASDMASHHLPLTVTHSTLCAEFFTHSATVVSISLGPVENTVISAAADGSVFVHSYAEQAKRGNHAAGAAAATAYDFDAADDGAKLNKEVVLLAQEDIEDHVNEVIELQKLLSETRAKNEFQARKLELEHNEALRRVSELHDQTLTKEKESFEKQRSTFDKRIRELMATIESKESDHIKVLTELENKYEHKLADQLERYDMLSEKMQLLKQKCEGLLEAEKVNFERQMNELKGKFNGEEKRYKLENKRAIEDKVANESALKEIINQQEDEYEDELRQLIQAAESELVSERDTILKLRTLVQTKNTKLDQLKKKLIELQTASKARLAMLNQEKAEKQKLLDTIEHYKKNLIEREDALAEKEKMVLELRSKTRTLENFRFVLDHRLQQLSSERGPITSHIEGLEKHISTMYEELVEEFSNKKAASEASVLKDQKINWISQDLNKMRQNVREKEQFIAAFKRELGNLISSMVVGKELEESVKVLYKKFVRGETGAKSSLKLNARVADTVNDIVHNGAPPPVQGNHHGGRHAQQQHMEIDDQSFLSTDTPGNGRHLPGSPMHTNANNMNAVATHAMASKSLIRDIEEALVETAKEADRQKKFVERQASNLKHRLQTNHRESHVLIRHRLHENSDLLFENSDLRMENKELHRKVNILKQQIEQLERTNTIDPRLTLPSLQPLQAPPGPLAPVNEVATTSNEVAPWVIHNSLTNAAMAVNNRRAEDVDSIHTITGQPISPGKPQNVVNSASMPNLSDNIADPVKMIAGHLSNTLNNIGKQHQSASVLQGSGMNVVRGMDKKTNKRVSVAVPQAAKSNERFNKEIENLAQQLDDSMRQNDMYRLEINKLKKQVMQLTHNSSHMSGVSKAAQMGSIDQNRGSLFLEGQELEEDSNLLHADMYGYPSEEDRQGMRVEGMQSVPASAQQRRTSGASNSSSQKQVGHFEFVFFCIF